MEVEMKCEVKWSMESMMKKKKKEGGKNMKNESTVHWGNRVNLSRSHKYYFKSISSLLITSSMLFACT
jgi:hypothetical protein